MEEELKIIKITNPLFLNNISKQIHDFSSKINITGITGETLLTYFAESIQRGGLQKAQGAEFEEFWVVYSGDPSDVDNPFVPHAFGHWYKVGLPSIGKVSVDFVYSWNTKKIPLSMLLDEFIKFGKRHRCVLYDADVLNERLFTVFKKAAESKGMKITRHGVINIVGRF